jgi:hypothetical protein
VEQTPRYDSFVVRIRHEAITGRILRAEIDHVQSGAVQIGREVEMDWILETLRNAMQRHDNRRTSPISGESSKEESENA